MGEKLRILMMNLMNPVPLWAKSFALRRSLGDPCEHILRYGVNELNARYRMGINLNVTEVITKPTWEERPLTRTGSGLFSTWG